MAEALQALGKRVRFSEYVGVGHDSWDQAYEEPEFFPWLFVASGLPGRSLALPIGSPVHPDIPFPLSRARDNLCPRAVRLVCLRPDPFPIMGKFVWDWKGRHWPAGNGFISGGRPQNGKMPQTLAEKIFSNHCGRAVRAGDFILAELDLVMAHDTTCAWALEPFYQIAERVFDPRKIFIPFDHAFPSPSVAMSKLQSQIRKFCR